jgi:hypothetical protein
MTYHPFDVTSRPGLGQQRRSEVGVIPAKAEALKPCVPAAGCYGWGAWFGSDAMDHPLSPA